jgi:hypothetical protein
MEHLPRELFKGECALRDIVKELVFHHAIFVRHVSLLIDCLHL